LVDGQSKKLSLELGVVLEEKIELVLNE